MAGDEELLTYAASRWPAVVRVLALLGAPPPVARDLAADAVSRLLDRVGEDDWVDLDVVLTASVLQAWEECPIASWGEPVRPAVPGVLAPDVEAGLDRLDADARARLAVTAVLGLSPEQVDEALGAADPVPPATAPVGSQGLAAAVAGVETGALDRDAVRRHRQARARRRRRSTLTVVAVAAFAVVVVAPLLNWALRGEPTTTVSTGYVEATAAARARLGAAPEPPPVTVAWYDGRSVHLGQRTVRLRGVVALSRADVGAVATTADGRVVYVRGSRPVPLGRTDPDGAAGPALSAGLLAAWVDRDELVIRSLAPEARGERAVRVAPDLGTRVSVPPDTRLVAVDGRRVHLDTPDGLVVVDPDGTSRPDVPGLVDAQGGAVLARLADGLRVLGPGEREVYLLGLDGRLSPDARYVLTLDDTAGSPQAPGPPARDTVVDLRGSGYVRLPLPAARAVSDSTFGSGDRAVFVLRRTQGAGLPGDPTFEPGFDILVCELVEVGCRTAVTLPEATRAPLLAR